MLSNRLDYQESQLHDKVKGNIDTEYRILAADQDTIDGDTSFKTYKKEMP